MKRAIGALITGLLLSGLVAALYEVFRGKSSAARREQLGREDAWQRRERQRRGAASRSVDLNQCSAEELASLAGLDSEAVDRIIEGRPYRNKLDLVSRMIIPEAVYVEISHQVVASEPDQPVKVAS
jgi:hypothetical protein